MKHFVFDRDHESDLTKPAIAALLPSLRPAPQFGVTRAELAPSDH